LEGPDRAETRQRSIGAIISGDPASPLEDYLAAPLNACFILREISRANPIGRRFEEIDAVWAKS
jgi:hypothetical protein